MVSKRIIPCLDVKDGKVVKGVNFVELQEAGEVLELAKKYSDEGADELVFLDISASYEKRKILINLVKDVSRYIRIPFTVGGGVSELKDFELLFKSGADKVSLNSSIIKNPNLITEAAKQFGSQAVVAAIDVKKINGDYIVFIKGGKESTGLNGIEWCKRCEEAGAGEILLTAMNNDGTRSGYDIELYKEVKSKVSIPVIASGGAGKLEHFKDVIIEANVDAVLAAGLFHYDIMKIKDLKNYLNNNKINIRL